MSINIKRSEETQSETTETSGNHGKSRRLRSLLAIAAVAVSSLGAGALVSASPAGAVVTQGNGTAKEWTYTSAGVACSVWVGDQYTSDYSAVGEADAYCTHAENLVVAVYLWHAFYYGGPMSVVASRMWSNYGTTSSGWTSPWKTEYGVTVSAGSSTDYWETMAYVSTNGGATWSAPMYSNYNHFEPYG